MSINQSRLRPWLAVVILSLASAASAEWKEKVLYSFQGGNDGAFPGGGVVFDQQGNLYGVTQAGGPPSCAPIGNYCGTVYELSPPVKQGDPWTKTLLFMFKGKKYNDGEVPDGLIIDAAGNLYGVTAYGGTGGCTLVGVPGGCGTVYELSPPKTKGGQWTYTVLYNFKSGKDGYLPGGNLVFDSAGNLYGATIFGGGKGTTCNPDYQYCGTVFELRPPKTKGGQWTEKVLHSFAGGTDGANPNGGLELDSQGAVYGTTSIGGYNCPHNSGQGCGTVFELKPPIKKSGVWTEEVLNRFNPGNSGAAEPVAGVIFDKGGSLYGTTVGGGNSGWGTIFGLAQGSGGKWIEHVLYRFRDGTDGSQPRAGVVFDAMGNFYGTATGGGTVGNGTVFRLRPDGGGSWAFAALYDFTVIPDGAYPTGLILHGAGNLYGTTQRGGSGQACGNYGCGTVFRVMQ
jgi:uncharacterized repeat protein (TIGR03803 family)